MVRDIATGKGSGAECESRRNEKGRESGLSRRLTARLGTVTRGAVSPHWLGYGMTEMIRHIAAGLTRPPDAGRMASLLRCRRGGLMGVASHLTALGGSCR